MTYFGNNSLITLTKFVQSQQPKSIEMPKSTYEWLFGELKRSVERPENADYLAKLPLPPRMEYLGITVTINNDEFRQGDITIGA